MTTDQYDRKRHERSKTLGHRDLSSTQIYARLDIDPVRKAMQTAVTAMLSNADGTGQGRSSMVKRTVRNREVVGSDPTDSNLPRRMSEEEMLSVEAAIAKTAGVSVEEITAHRAELQAVLRSAFEDLKNGGEGRLV